MCGLMDCPLIIQLFHQILYCHETFALCSCIIARTGCYNDCMQYWQRCEAVIDKLPNHIKVTYKGRLNATEAREVAKDYDAFFLPTMSENYGYVIEEALLCGCPVVISRGTTPWDDVDGLGGFAGDLDAQDKFVAELEKISNMDDTEYKRYVKNLHKYIYDKLSYEKLVNDYKTLIDRVATTKK